MENITTQPQIGGTPGTSTRAAVEALTAFDTCTGSTVKGKNTGRKP